MSGKRTKVLAISSGGGHWVQLLRLRPALVDSEVVFATVSEGYRQEVEGEEFRLIVDANRSEKINLVRSAWSILRLLLKEKPEVIISTGAAPGFFALKFGKLLGARTIWIDSVANAEELSMSGQKAGGCADLWLTQWAHLAKPEGPRCFGDVL